MSDYVYEIVKAALTLVVLLLFRYVIPWFKESLEKIKEERVVSEFSKLVYATQERYSDKTGAERRAIVTEKIKELLKAKNISLTDEQIRDLNDAAVKAMKIAEVASNTQD